MFLSSPFLPFLVSFSPDNGNDNTNTNTNTNNHSTIPTVDSEGFNLHWTGSLIITNYQVIFISDDRYEVVQIPLLQINKVERLNKSSYTPYIPPENKGASSSSSSNANITNNNNTNNTSNTSTILSGTMFLHLNNTIGSTSNNNK